MHDIRIAQTADAGEAGRILAAGFGDDPVLCWVFEEPDRAAKLGALFGFLAAEAFVPLGATRLCHGSCAAWTPPDTPEWPDDRVERLFATLGAIASGDDLGRLAVMEAAMQAHHPTERHWYLGVLATEPPLRGRGAGAALLADSLAVVDAERLPAYLESTNPRNVPLYERHGFEVTGSIELPGGPPLTPMWRAAR